MSTYAPNSSVSGSNDVSTNSNSSMISDMQLCNEIADLMTILDTDYLGIYEYAVSAMTRYWKDFSNQIQEILLTGHMQTKRIFILTLTNFKSIEELLFLYLGPKKPDICISLLS